MHGTGTNCNVSSNPLTSVHIDGDLPVLLNTSSPSVDSNNNNPVKGHIECGQITRQNSFTDDLISLTKDETCTLPKMEEITSRNTGLRSVLSNFSGTYEPVHVEPELEIFPKFSHESHLIGGLTSQLNASAWLSELAYENDAWLKSYIPEDKLSKLHHELDFFQNKSRATCRQLQRLCGILSYCARVIRGGRTFSHRVISLLKDIQTNKRIRLSPCCRADLLWWKSFCNIFNGSATMVKYNFGNGPIITTVSSLCDYGLFIHAGTYSDWQAGWFDTAELPTQLSRLQPEHRHWKNIQKPLVTATDDNINLLELIPVWQSVMRFAPRFRGCHLVLQTDNTQVMSMINCGKSINVSCMCLVREIFWLCIMYNIYLTARYVLGCNNYIADCLSRITSDSLIRSIDDCMLCCSGERSGLPGWTSC